MPLSPGQWMLVGENDQGPAFCQDLTKRLKGLGYASEQSGARACFRISGGKVAEFMQRCCRLDLHPTKASDGFCAQTQMAQIGVLIHQVADAPAYDLYVFSGFAQDFAEWLVHTAEKYGVEYGVER